MTRLRNKEPALPPWERILHKLRSDSGGSHLFDFIQGCGGGRYGIIIGGWDASKELVSYLSETGGKWGFIRFNDERRRQDPRMYPTLEKAEKALTRIERERHEPNSPWVIPPYVGLVLWVHPEHFDAPITEFQTLRARFPLYGSPRR